MFARSSRINSTWGGNLVDMVRCQRILEIIVEENLADHITSIGDHVIQGLRSIARETEAFTNVRGRGSLIAFTFNPAGLNVKAMRDPLPRTFVNASVSRAIDRSPWMTWSPMDVMWSARFSSTMISRMRWQRTMSTRFPPQVELIRLERANT